MIDTRTLMRDNLLKHNGIVIKVDEVKAEGVVSKGRFYKSEELEPIEITEKWMDKLGFIEPLSEYKRQYLETGLECYDDTYGHSVWIGAEEGGSDTVIMSFYDHHTDSDKNSCNMVESWGVSYVHDIQNLHELLHRHHGMRKTIEI